MIERGVPIPTDDKVELHSRIPDLLQMKVGDSTVADEKEVGRVSNIELCLWGMKRNQQHKLAQLDNEFHGKVRIWRVR